MTTTTDDNVLDLIITPLFTHKTISIKVWWRRDQEYVVEFPTVDATVSKLAIFYESGQVDSL